MFSFRMLLCAAALTLLAVTVESWSDGNLSGAELTRLYNSPVREAEKMVRPKKIITPVTDFFRIRATSLPNWLRHSGVRLTIGDESQWLTHKGKNYGDSSDTVVTRADQMSSRWEPIETKNFNGERTVADFVEAGGDTYNVLKSNCHHASDDMMSQ